MMKNVSRWVLFQCCCWLCAGATNAREVQVQAFIAYPCPACFQVYDGFQNHAFGDGVKIQYLPATIWPEWRLFSKLFLTLEQMNRQDLHHQLFTEIHINSNNNNELDFWREWLSRHGVVPEDFEQVYFSYDINAKLEQIEQMRKQYAISSVPAIIINEVKVHDAESLQTTRNAISIIEAAAR